MNTISKRIKKTIRLDAAMVAMQKGLRAMGLHTVCEEARCPNISECFGERTATFLLMGSACTRSCGFCSVSKGAGLVPPDPGEAERIAETIAGLGLRYVVLTSVTRDDLPDGGAGYLSRATSIIKDRTGTILEMLFPDFQGDPEAIETISRARLDVFGHNIEMVERLYGSLRPSSDYRTSLDILSQLSRKGLKTKTGFMVGLGESRDELERLLDDISSTGASLLTIGQYFQPDKTRVPVARFYSETEFEELQKAAESKGINKVFAGRFVRSSYKAAETAGLPSGAG